MHQAIHFFFARDNIFGPPQSAWFTTVMEDDRTEFGALCIVHFKKSGTGQKKRYFSEIYYIIKILTQQSNYN